MHLAAGRRCQPPFFALTSVPVWMVNDAVSLAVRLLLGASTRNAGSFRNKKWVRSSLGFCLCARAQGQLSPEAKRELHICLSGCSRDTPRSWGPWRGLLEPLEESTALCVCSHVRCTMPACVCTCVCSSHRPSLRSVTPAPNALICASGRGSNTHGVLQTREAAGTRLPPFPTPTRVTEGTTVRV